MGQKSPSATVTREAPLRPPTASLRPRAGAMAAGGGTSQYVHMMIFGTLNLVQSGFFIATGPPPWGTRQGGGDAIRVCHTDCQGSKGHESAQVPPQDGGGSGAAAPATKALQPKCLPRLCRHVTDCTMPAPGDPQAQT